MRESLSISDRHGLEARPLPIGCDIFVKIQEIGNDTESKGRETMEQRISPNKPTIERTYSLSASAGLANSGTINVPRPKAMRDTVRSIAPGPSPWRHTLERWRIILTRGFAITIRRATTAIARWSLQRTVGTTASDRRSEARRWCNEVERSGKHEKEEIKRGEKGSDKKRRTEQNIYKIFQKFQRNRAHTRRMKGRLEGLQ